MLYGEIHDATDARELVTSLPFLVRIISCRSHFTRQTKLKASNGNFGNFETRIHKRFLSSFSMWEQRKRSSLTGEFQSYSRLKERYKTQLEKFWSYSRDVKNVLSHPFHLQYCEFLEGKKKKKKRHSGESSCHREKIGRRIFTMRCYQATFVLGFCDRVVGRVRNRIHQHRQRRSRISSSTRQRC